jgi:hypothetical protein
MGLSAIGRLRRMPMICSTWTLSVEIASFFDSVVGAFQGKSGAEDGLLVAASGPTLK